MLTTGQYKPFISTACCEVATGAVGAGLLFVDSFFSFLSFSGGSVGAGRLG